MYAFTPATMEDNQGVLVKNKNKVIIIKMKIKQINKKLIKFNTAACVIRKKVFAFVMNILFEKKKLAKI